jgi:hypothetical protein
MVGSSTQKLNGAFYIVVTKKDKTSDPINRLAQQSRPTHNNGSNARRAARGARGRPMHPQIQPSRGVQCLHPTNPYGTNRGRRVVSRQHTGSAGGGGVGRGTPNVSRAYRLARSKPQTRSYVDHNGNFTQVRRKSRVSILQNTRVPIRRNARVHRNDGWE